MPCVPRRARTLLSTTLFLAGGFCQISAGFAQGKSARAEPESATTFGAVTGHVYFQGNDAPARLVNVALQPIQITFPERFQAGKPPQLNFTIYQTGLDGAYAIPHVRPGVYYVVATVPGFLSPFAQFTPEEMAHPTPALAQRMAATLPVVSVQPNSTAVLDVRVERGATLSGIIRFDDGTPFVDAEVLPQRRSADGKWVSVRISGRRAKADADGRWQVGGLLPGEYRMRVSLELDDRKQDAVIGEGADFSHTRYTLDVYSGDTTRESQAKSITLDENQQGTGQDITVPVSKLHAVSGALLDARTGQPLNAGDVRLVYADDGKNVAQTSIDAETRTFTFPFVPEGEYKLTTKNVREARFELKTDPDPDPMATNYKETTLRQYAPGEMPVTVTGETTGVNLAVQLQTQAQTQTQAARPQ